MKRIILPVMALILLAVLPITADTGCVIEAASAVITEKGGVCTLSVSVPEGTKQMAVLLTTTSEAPDTGSILCADQVTQGDFVLQFSAERAEAMLGGAFDPDTSELYLWLGGESTDAATMTVVPKLPEHPLPTGDLDGNDQVTVNDVLICLRGLLNGTADPALADMNGDGKVSLVDVLRILKLSAQ